MVIANYKFIQPAKIQTYVIIFLFTLLFFHHSLHSRNTKLYYVKISNKNLKIKILKTYLSPRMSFINQLLLKVNMFDVTSVLCNTQNVTIHTIIM